MFGDGWNIDAYWIGDSGHIDLWGVIRDGGYIDPGHLLGDGRDIHYWGRSGHGWDIDRHWVGDSRDTDVGRLIRYGDNWNVFRDGRDPHIRDILRDGGLHGDGDILRNVNA